MSKVLPIDSINEAFEFLYKKGFSIDESRSIFLKFYLLKKHGLVGTIESKTREISIKKLIEEKCEISSRYLKNIERYYVSEELISVNFIERLFTIFSNLTDNQFFMLLDTEKARKNKGQYFTPPEIVSEIYSSLFSENIEEEIKHTIIDFSAGLGEFLKPLINNLNYIFYAVELDPISHEFLLFNLIWNQEYDVNQKIKALLVIIQGDSLLGYQEDLLERLIATSEGYELLKNLSQIRREILYDKVNDSLEKVKHYFKLREEISNYQESLSDFNWFVDFPEIFFDENLKKLESFGFDYVVGNPPWISFQAINHVKYRALFSNEFFSRELYGKFNFALPFMTLSHELSKESGGVVIPQGILSETYAQIWREKIIENKSLSKIALLSKEWFDDILNEFCIVYWKKKYSSDLITVTNEEIKQEIEIEHKRIKPPLYRIPLIPNYILEQIEHIYDLSVELHEVCEIRRGLTLSKNYQDKYFQTMDRKSNQYPIKRLIRHNRNNNEQKEGVFNFQVHFAGEEFVYDKTLLGAPGSSDLFEQPKIIRRNRGRYWLLGLDVKGDYYVNDIFDIIFPKKDKEDIKVIFGCLNSSLFQFLAENYLQRDITSNFVRKLPYPILSEKNNNEIRNAVNDWLSSKKHKDDIRILRREIDRVINKHYKLSKEVKDLLENKAILRWID